MTKVVTHDLYLILFSGDISCNLLWSVSSKQCNEVKVQLCIFSKLQITFPSAVQQIFSCEAREDTFPISHSWAWKEILKMDFNTFFASNKSHLASRSKHIMLTKKWYISSNVKQTVSETNFSIVRRKNLWANSELWKGNFELAKG